METMATNAAMIPFYALDLFRRYWAPLLCVYVVGTFLHDMLILGVVWLAAVHPLLGLVGLSLAVLATLASTIIMFHLLSPGLPTLRAELAGPRGPDGARTTFGERERRFVDAVAMAILPFLLFYSAWGLFVEEVRQYATTTVNERGIEAYAQISGISAVGLPLVVAVAFWVGRAVCERLYERTENKWLGVLTAVFEANWMFFAIFTIAQLVTNARGWLSDRVVFADVNLAVDNLVRWVGELTQLPATQVYVAALTFVGELWTHLKDGLFEPLLWLTIVAVVFGAEIDRAEALFRKGGRADRIQRRVTERTPGALRGIGRLLGRDLHEKYTPFLNAFRFIMRVSPVFYLSFCLYYVLLELAFGWLERGIYLLFGPHEFLAWWWQWLGPVDFGVGALHELLRVCLLAAAFEMTLRRLGTRSVGRRARRNADHLLDQRH